MPFEEIPHTADWSLRAWAKDLPELLVEAARGMYLLAGVKLTTAPRVTRSLAIPMSDPESLLVGFLSELLYIGEEEHLAFDGFLIQQSQGTLKAEMNGAPILSLDKIIKAVTYHNLQVVQTSKGVEATIVFDV